MNKILAIATLICISICSVGFAGTQQPQLKENAKESAKTNTKANATIEKGTLLFFLNPNGYPCQQQDKILKQNMNNIQAKADISYISTTDPMSRFSFNRYGVRRLPSLILLNANGEISKHFPPGIRSAEEINNAINELKLSCIPNDKSC
ncbi:MAG: hypothetical protein D6B28_09615 [Gammaproteobacteria bacterium]|nr:MAG: hypothetical protein D6B28_09615 [Gammaproteobacteria bacterium]